MMAHHAAAFPSGVALRQDGPSAADPHMQLLQAQIQELLLLDGSDSSRREAAAVAAQLMQHCQSGDHSTEFNSHQALDSVSASHSALRALLSPADAALVPARPASAQNTLQQAFEATRAHRAVVPAPSSHQGLITHDPFSSHLPPPIASSLSSDPEAQSRVSAVHSQLDSLHESLRRFRYARINQAFEYRHLLPAAPPAMLHLLDAGMQEEALQRQLPYAASPSPSTFSHAYMQAQPSRASISVINSPRNQPHSLSVPSYQPQPVSYPPAAFHSSTAATAAAAASGWLTDEAHNALPSDHAHSSTLEQQVSQWYTQQQQQQQQAHSYLPAAAAAAFSSQHPSRAHTPAVIHTAADSGVPIQPQSSYPYGTAAAFALAAPRAPVQWQPPQLQHAEPTTTAPHSIASQYASAPHAPLQLYR